MATASVVQLFPKSIPAASARRRESAKVGGAKAAVLQFPRRQTLEEVIREWVILSARYMPHIYPGGLPRDVERSVARWAQVASLRDGMRQFMTNRWFADIATYAEELAHGRASFGRYGDPDSEAHWYECCVRSYGKPEEGHEAWEPWLEQLAAGIVDGQAELVRNGLRKE